MIHHEDAATLAEIEALLEEGEIHSVLRLLNQRTSHRFTGIYRFDAPMLRNLALYDRNNPELRIGADAPMRETYCSRVGETEDAFATPDAQGDARLVEHPARESTLAYCGVPLRDKAGVVGSLCHFDVVPRPVPEEEVPLLHAAAPLLTGALRSQGRLA